MFRETPKLFDRNFIVGFFVLCCIYRHFIVDDQPA